MSFYIVGTAGHIDHGKTELSKALTGIQTDRLKEEQERGMSIKLGFAPLELTNSIKVGLVDVPGHEKFIQQMLSGASGMDLVILVIAANEGIMPQTKEHIDIIFLLGIKNIVVALTKKSLVEPDFLELVEEDIRDYLEKRGYLDVPIIPVDSITKEGIEELKETLAEELQKIPEKERGNFPRLPIDRVFTLTGHGTIATGTLWSGKIRKGDQMMIFPINKIIKVRNIQVHGKNVDEAIAGQRVAINIPDLSTKDIPSGSIILKENIIQPTFKVTGLFKLLPDKTSLENLEKVRVHLGTSETLAKLIILDGNDIYPEEEKLAGLYLEKPIGTVFGDRLVIRRENASETLGGFMVIEANPGKLKRNDKSYLGELIKKAEGTLEDKLVSLIREKPFISLKDMTLKLAADESSIKDILRNHIDDIHSFENHFLLKEQLEEIRRALLSYLRKKVAVNPLVGGAPKEELKSKLFKDIGTKPFNSLLTFMENDTIEILGDFIKEKGYRITLSPEEDALIKRILATYRKDGINSKKPSEMAEFLRISLDKYLKYHNYLLTLKELVKIDENITLSKDIYDRSIADLIDYCEMKGSIDITEAKEVLNTSRKYIVPFLEHLDYMKVTKRVENKRILTRR